MSIRHFVCQAVEKKKKTDKMATQTTSTCAEILKKFVDFTKKPESFLGVQDNLIADVKCAVKQLYDLTKTKEEAKVQSDALPELIIQDFDDEQIWQELELQNDGKCNSFILDIAQLVARKDKLRFPVRFQDEESTDESEHSEESLEVEADDAELEEQESQSDSTHERTKKVKKRVNKKRGRPTIVDDRFFKLRDFDELDKLENAVSKNKQNDSDTDDNSDVESIDWFGEVGALSDEEKEGERYNDFFDVPEDAAEGNSCNEDDQQHADDDDDEDELDLSDHKEQDSGGKQVRFNFLDDDEEDEDPSKIETPEPKSNFETRQDRLKSRISALEAEALGDKPWQLKGEVSATSRPQNSLLEEFVEFDLTSRPAPIITEQTTLKLEDLIVQRIKDKAWDDVERKVKPVDTPQEYKKKLVLNQEKSKLSLAQIYEEDYLKQKNALRPNNDEDEEEEEPEEHRVIRVMMNSLFSKLDALSNFHYTPKPVLPEVKIVSNVSAITMEEVAPVGTTTATLLAPEEVKAKPKGDVMGLSERTATDRKRERRHKKMMQRDRNMEKEKRVKLLEKINPGLGNKYSKEKAALLLEKVVKDKNVTQIQETRKKLATNSSTSFFNQLQDEVTSHIKSKTQKNKKQKIETISAKRIKL